MAGSLAIPFVFAGIATCTDSISHLDTDLSTIAAYINVREVTFGLFANRPAPGTHGAAYYATDIGGGTLYLDTGAAWLSVSSAIAVGTLASRPAAGTAGRSYLATDIGSYGATFIDNGSAWVLQPSVVDRVYAVTITNTAAETTIYSKNYVANALPTTGRFRVTILGKITCTEAVATATFTLRCKFGGTTLTTQTLTVSAATATTNIGANQPFKAVLEVQNLNAANSQAGITVLDSVAMDGDFAAATWKIVGTGADGAAAAAVTAHTTGRGTSAIDTTAAAILAATAQWDTNNVNRSFTADAILVEML